MRGEKMKKILSLVLVLLLAFGIVACGNSGSGGFTIEEPADDVSAKIETKKDTGNTLYNLLKNDNMPITLTEELIKKIRDTKDCNEYKNNSGQVLGTSIEVVRRKMISEKMSAWNQKLNIDFDSKSWNWVD